MLATLILTAALLQNPDARLVAKVTLSENIASLKTLCEDLQKQTHVPFVADKLVRDRKVALFVENRPASEAMWAVEQTLFLKFDPYNGGYRLILPDRIRVEEREVVDDEKAAYREGIASALTRLAGLATKSMHDLDQEYADLMDRMRTLAAKTDAKSQADLAAALARQQEMEGYRAAGVAAALSKQVSAVSDSLMAGETIVVTSDPKLGPFVMDPNLAPWMPGDKGQEKPPAIVYATVSYLPARDALKVLVLDYEDSNSDGRQNYADIQVSRKIDWTKERFVKRLSEWGYSPDSAVFRSSLPAPPKAPPSPYRGKAFSLADHLKYLAKATGIPMCADAFRLAVSGEQYYGAPNLAQYVAKLMNPQPNYSPRVGYEHAENGWLMLRHYDTWMLQDAEVPENLIAPLEAKSQGDAIPTLDDYAKFAGALNLDQAASFRLAMPILMRCPRNPLYCMMPLRLWDRLSGPEREAAAKEALSLDQLSPANGLLFRLCLVDAMDSAGVKLSDIQAVLGGDPALRFGCFPMNHDGDFHMLNMEEISFGGGSKTPMVDRADQTMFTYKLQNRLLGMDICTILHKPQ